jgi:prevent-host-death family protein
MAVELSIITSSEARNNFRGILDSVFARRKDYIIERNGVEVAAVIPVEEYKEVKEELQAFRAAMLAEEMYEAYKAGAVEGSTLEELEAEFG